MLPYTHPPCHEHPLGGEARRYWCGHYCYDKPCLIFRLAYRLGLR